MSICNNNLVLNRDELKDDIFQLFDFTTNQQSRAVLKRILGATSLRSGEIFERQEILKGYLYNWRWLNVYAYSKSELYEVVEFSKRLYQTDWIGIPDQNRFRVKWMQSRKSR